MNPQTKRLIQFYLRLTTLKWKLFGKFNQSSSRFPKRFHVTAHKENSNTGYEQHTSLLTSQRGSHGSRPPGHPEVDKVNALTPHYRFVIHCQCRMKEKDVVIQKDKLDYQDFNIDVALCPKMLYTDIKNRRLKKRPNFYTCKYILYLVVFLRVI